MFLTLTTLGSCFCFELRLLSWCQKEDSRERTCYDGAGNFQRGIKNKGLKSQMSNDFFLFFLCMLVEKFYILNQLKTFTNIILKVPESVKVKKIKLKEKKISIIIFFFFV